MSIGLVIKQAIGAEVIKFQRSLKKSFKTRCFQETFLLPSALNSITVVFNLSLLSIYSLLHVTLFNSTIKACG